VKPLTDWFVKHAPPPVLSGEAVPLYVPFLSPLFAGDGEDPACGTAGFASGGGGG
jgi:hypothetical protein